MSETTRLPLLRLLATTALSLGMMVVLYHLLQSPAPAALRWSAVIALAACVGLTLRTLPATRGPEFWILGGLFTLMWAWPIFHGYLTFDELSRFQSLPPLSKIFVTPVNDHLHPLMWLVWWVQYGLLSGNYLVIAGWHFVVGLAGVLALAAVVLQLLPGRSTPQRVFVTLFACLSTHSPVLWTWKGCGDAPLLSFLAFAFWLLALLQSDRRSGFGYYALCTALYLVMVGSSSLITLGFVYALPLLLLPRYRTPRFAIVVGLGFLATAGYWLLRSAVVERAFKPIHWLDLPGALAGTWYQYTYASIPVGAALLLLLLVGLRTLPRQPRSVLAVAGIASFVFFVGVLQLFGAREMTLRNSFGLRNYHLFFPWVGCALLLVAVGYGWIAATSARAAWTLVGAVSLYYLAVQVRFTTAEAGEVDTVIARRAAFLSDLRTLRDSGAVVPDRSFATSARRAEFKWCPDNLLEPGTEHAGWHDFTRLGNLQHLIGGGLKLAPQDTPPADPATARFIDLYWGKLQHP